LFTFPKIAGYVSGCLSLFDNNKPLCAQTDFANCIHGAILADMNADPVYVAAATVCAIGIAMTTASGIAGR
jgi:hypothetical protein